MGIGELVGKVTVAARGDGLDTESGQHGDGEGKRKDPAEGGMGLLETGERIDEGVERCAKDAAEGKEG